MDLLETTSLRLNDIFVQSPGDFLYFFAVTSLVLISFLMALWLRDQDHPLLQRYPIALGGVVFVWGLMFAGALFVNFVNQTPDTILPPLERAVSAASLVLLGWAFFGSTHEERRKLTNGIALFLLFIISAGYLITGVLWVNQSTQVDFNLSTVGLLWTLGVYIVALLGLLVTVFLARRVIDAPLKMIYFILVTVGAGITLYQVTRMNLIGNYAGTFRLFFLLAYVIVPLLVYRLVVARYEHLLIEARNRPSTQPMPSVPAQSPPATPTPVRIHSAEAVNARLLKALGQMLETGQPADIPHAIVNTISDTLKADIGALLRLQDANYADLNLAQDRLLNRALTGMSLNLDHQPTLVNAIERRTQRALYLDRNVEELDDLYTRLEVEQIGPVYFQPLSHQQEVFAVVMIAMPYTKRELSQEETELLTGMGIVAGNLLALSYSAEEATHRAEDRIIQAMVEGVPPSDVQAREMLEARLNMQENLKLAREQIAQLTRQVLELKDQLDHERGRMQDQLGVSEEGLSISQQMQAINSQQENLREERDHLMRRLQEAEAALQGATASDNEEIINNMVEALQREKSALEAEKNRLESQLKAFQTQEQMTPGEMQRLLNRMVEEKARLEQERDQLDDELKRLENQLQAIGIETNEAGLAQLIGTLYEERAALAEQNDLLKQERAALLSERQELEIDMQRKQDRDARIQMLADQVERLMADTETLTRQRDKIRIERDELQHSLNSVKEHRARLLAQASGYELEMTDMREEMAQLRQQLQEAADYRSKLINSRDKLLAENQALTTELDQLMSQFDGDPARLKQVSDQGVGSLRDMVQDLSQQRDQLARELNEARAELAQAERELIAAQAITPTANGNTPVYQPSQPELLVGLVQEFRSPMTAISGYIDLMLNESAGILGEMQRIFLRRVAANIARLDTMIDALINVTQLDTGSYSLEPHDVDLIRLIEESITTASIQFQEKELAVQLDLDDDMPLVPADVDSLNQVIDQLLTNAYLVSPPGGSISVAAVQRLVRYDQEQEPRASVCVSITDSGGGIDPDDVPRVFARKYRADHPLIAGLGDTGVGMSIARALVEAHHGRLWVESQAGQGSTFTFAIPLDLEPEGQKD